MISIKILIIITTLNNITMSSVNVYTFNNQELVSFLQKIGQHEAAKVIHKYYIDGKTLMSLSGQNVNLEFDTEKNILSRCITLINFNPVLSLSLRKLYPLEEEISSPLPEEDSLAEDPNNSSRNSDIHNTRNLIISDTQVPISTPENTSINLKELQGSSPVVHGTDSTDKYFTFSALQIEKQRYKHFPPNKELPRGSIVSADYIYPASIVIPRYEEIVVDRIKQFVRTDQIATVKKEPHYEVILPNQVVVHAEEENTNKTTAKRRVLCDLILNMCGLSCFLGCQKKPK